VWTNPIRPVLRELARRAEAWSDLAAMLFHRHPFAGNVKTTKIPLCFWFRSCVLSLAAREFQPITASGQSRARYDSFQTERGRGGASRSDRTMLNIPWCKVTKTLLKMMGNGSWILKGRGQCTMNISHVTDWSKSLYHPPYEIICCIFQKYFICGVYVCVYIYI